MDATHGRGARAEAVVARLAAQQHGVFSRAQAIEAGFKPRAIGRRLTSGMWISPDTSVYQSAAVPRSWELVVMAACLAGPAAGSHRCAARLAKLAGFRAAAPEVTAYRHRRRRSTSVVWHESHFLGEARDTTVIDGIPVTRVTRTIVDLSAVATEVEIEIALDDACNRGLTTVAQVVAEVERLHRISGSARIRAVLGLKAPDTDGIETTTAESPLESRAAIVLRSSGLPVPVAQFEVFDGASFVARVDFAWPERRVALEVDGYAFHGDRAAWEKDRQRSSRLAAIGWRVHHVTNDGLGRPNEFVAGLRKSLCVH